MRLLHPFTMIVVTDARSATCTETLPRSRLLKSGVICSSAALWGWLVVKVVPSQQE